MLDKIKRLVYAKKPEIMLGSGFILVGGGIVGACNASRKLDDVLEEAADRIEDAKLKDLTDYEYSKEVNSIKLDCAMKLGKMYAWPAGCIFLGGKFILGSHQEMSTRLADTAGELALTAATFGAYRGRVRREIGTDADNHFMYGTKSEEIYTPGYTDEDGVEHPPTTNVYDETVDSSELDDQYIIFDERSAFFDRENPQNNITFLMQAEMDLRTLLIGNKKLYRDRIKERLGLYNDIKAKDRTFGFLYIPPADPSAAYDARADETFSLGLFNPYDRQLRKEGELEKAFVLYPTSHGCGPVYILDLHDKVKKK